MNQQKQRDSSDMRAVKGYDEDSDIIISDDNINIFSSDDNVDTDDIVMFENLEHQSRVLNIYTPHLLST